jgi:pimeloyl-ACP methyl ester carboxylesterase
MPRFTSDGLSLNYTDQGEGDPVLLIHGFASNLSMNWVGTKWIDVLLKAGFRVIAFDHRGHGESDKVYDPERYTIGDMAKDTAALMDHLGIAKADLIGFSMGARVAAYLAITQPERARSLVIGGMGTRLFGGASKTDEIAEALEAPSRDDVKDAYARVFRVFAENTKSDLKALAAVIRSPRLPLTKEMVGGLKIPVLVAVGSEDVVAGDPQELADAIPGARVLPIPGKDHNKSVADPAFKEGVIAFLKERP